MRRYFFSILAVLLGTAAGCAKVSLDGLHPPDGEVQRAAQTAPPADSKIQVRRYRSQVPFPGKFSDLLADTSEIEFSSERGDSIELASRKLNSVSAPMTWISVRVLSPGVTADFTFLLQMDLNEIAGQSLRMDCSFGYDPWNRDCSLLMSLQNDETDENLFLPTRFPGAPLRCVLNLELPVDPKMEETRLKFECQDLQNRLSPIRGNVASVLN